MSYEDSFEQEAADERAYDRFESKYIYENFKPLSICNREWLLMFARNPSYSSYGEAAREAREMARELARPVEIHLLYEGCFQPLPIDYYKRPEGSFWTLYATKRASYIKELVIEGRYPGMVKLAYEIGDTEKYGIARHFLNETVGQHRRWRDAAKQQP